MKEKWTANFSKPEKSCFDIKPENSFNAYLEKGSLFFGLKKKNCMAWLETVKRVYTDQVIEARFQFGNSGTYCAAGIMFHVTGRGAGTGDTGAASGTGVASDTFYLALISSKGYFRCDAVNNGISRPLVGWTEASCPPAGRYGLNERGAHLNIITRGDHLIFILNGRWIAELRDNSVSGGHLGFALVSYDDTDSSEPPAKAGERYSCQAWLDFLSVDSRTRTVETVYEKWNNSREITAESRLRLAQSFAALDHAGAAYDQLLKAWKQREEAARSVTATYTEMRAKGELLLAARTAQKLGRLSTAEEYVDAYLSMSVAGTEEMEALAEKAKILSALHKYRELAAFLPAFIKKTEAVPARAPEDLSALYALFGYACQNLKDYESAASAWDTAFSLNSKNGLYAVSAAAAYEFLGKTEAAAQRRLNGARTFLRQNEFTEMGELASKIPFPELFAAGNRNLDLAEDLEAALKHSPDDKNLLDFAAAFNSARIKYPPEPEAPAKTAAELPSPPVAKTPPAVKKTKTPAKVPEKTGAKPKKEPKTAAKPVTKPATKKAAASVLKAPAKKPAAKPVAKSPAKKPAAKPKAAKMAKMAAPVKKDTVAKKTKAPVKKITAKAKK